MFTSYGADNYNSTEGLLTWFDQELESKTYTDDEGVEVTVHAVKITRHVTKRYAFVYMTAAAADQCVTAKTAQYTRAFDEYGFDGRGVIHPNTVTKCKTGIAIVGNDNGSFDVTIAVNETDIRYVSAPAESSFINDPASYFSSGRDYDESIVSKTTAGLSTHTSANLRVTQGLTITYDATKHPYWDDEGSETSSTWFEYTRYATKRYVYVGMRQSTAETFAAAKIAQYTRVYSLVNSSETSIAQRASSRKILGAQIALRHNGVFWEVEIAVNEVDVKASASSVNPATLFSSENARDYS